MQSNPIHSDAKSIYERILLTIATINLYANITVYTYSLTINKWVKNLQSILLTTFFAFFISINSFPFIHSLISF